MPEEDIAGSKGGREGVENGDSDSNDDIEDRELKSPRRGQRQKPKK